MTYDKTFCPYWLLCKKGEKCEDALTKAVREGAEEAGCPLWYYTGKPKCFEGKKEGK